MAEVLDLRQFRSSQLDELLTAQTEEWRRDLDWDYSSSADLIRQYIEARILPGYVLVDGGPQNPPLHGYGFFIYEAQKGLIGDLYVHPAHRQPARQAERRLLDHMIETLQGTPGVVRIEAQLMAFRPDDLAASFTRADFRAYRRHFLHLDLNPGPGRPAAPADLDPASLPLAATLPLADIRLEPWSSLAFEEPARLILQAYRGHVDSLINDQYRHFAGAVRFLNNIAHYPGCGYFDAVSSLLARDRDSGRLEAMVLISRVRPDVAHITQICVAPQRQGRGLGRALLEAALLRLRRQSLRAVTLTVTRDNEPACTLYQRLGFVSRRDFDAYVWERPRG